MFKASDYRISPFELESVLIEHPAVAEAAVVPAPDELRLAVPKAYVVLVAGHEPSAELAGDILAFCREHLAPYKRIRRLQFADLPKTISGKIRRVELRTAEAETAGTRPAGGVPRRGLRLSDRRESSSFAGRAPAMRGATAECGGDRCDTAPMTATRSSGASSTCRPRLPAETYTVSNELADSSTTTGSRGFCPIGEMPPTT